MRVPTQRLHRGTFFARCVVPRGSRLPSELALPGGVPALLVARGGVVLGKAHISQFGGQDIWGEQVRRTVGAAGAASNTR
jgi:hypothetical protein